MRGNEFRSGRVIALAAIFAGLAPALLHAQEGASGRLAGLSLSGKEPIQIESDRLEVVEAESKAIFSGNVNVNQGPTLLKAGKMTVYYLKDKQGESSGSAATGSANIDRLLVEDKVYIKSGTQVATGDRGEFNMQTEILVLSGKQVVLSEGSNTLVGCKLTANMTTGKADVEGCPGARVMMVLDPGSQNQ